jgi:predicted helicase
LKPSSAAVQKYYGTIEQFSRAHFDKEGNIRGAFEDLLKNCSRQHGWTVVPEYTFVRKDRHPASIDAAILDAFNIPRGYWEAKDEKDSLKAEMKKKFEAGYPRTNILFQRPTEALLFQDGRIAFHESIEDPKKLVEVLRMFFEWRQPEIDSWDRAVGDFSQRIPDIAQGALKLIEEERKRKGEFVQRFAAFADLCRDSINPDLKDEAVEEMLVQHLLTERIFRRIFDNPEFTRRNVIAAEIEKVIDSLTKRHFSRDAFLRDLDPFYKAIEEAASTTETYGQKQAFLNSVYERFFQGFNRKQADTHGIVYTPQSIVDFMVRSVEDVLKSEFGRSLSDKDVHILDPFVGTGNFITRVMQEIKTSRLEQKYKTELHCNEVMLLPYYIASMNIEHAYLDRVGEYEPFEGICLVDTFELAEPRQTGFEFMNEGNTARIRKQKKSPIFVVIGNPPYNAWQQSENDANKNRKYPELSKRISETYAKASKATNKNALSDPYVKAFRFATDRIRNGGLICFVSNSSFIDQRAFDGMRKYLSNEFDKVYVLDLGGNVRQNPKLSGTTHNVFGIQVGVSITMLVKSDKHDAAKKGEVFYFAVGKDLRKEQKYQFLAESKSINGVKWKTTKPNENQVWLTEGLADDFDSLMALDEGLFQVHSNGVKTNRDSWVYNFHRTALARSVSVSIDFFNGEVNRWKRRPAKDVDSFVVNDPKKISWSRDLKQELKSGRPLCFDEGKLTTAAYRPFCKQNLYFDPVMNEEVYTLSKFAPWKGQNTFIVITGPGSEKEFMVIATDALPDVHVVGPGATGQCFAFNLQDADGCHDNITDSALAEFRSHYGQNSISKRDIFHYTYALLHHPGYRSRYAANLKRELPRIPFAPDFTAYADIGAKLMKLHIDYEQQPEHPLQRTETGKLDWRVEKMAISKDKTQLKYNGFLTFSGIPPEAYEYRLGNRSALEWIVDQYCVSTDSRSGIINDPNRDDDPEYIVRLIGQVTTVSIESVRLVHELSALPLLTAGDRESDAVEGVLEEVKP